VVINSVSLSWWWLGDWRQRSGALRTSDFARSSEIIVGALALTISLEFEIFAEKLKSTATSFHALLIAQPPPTPNWGSLGTILAGFKIAGLLP
jgi:hypothetical protein